jgi:hypothetical protein
MRSDWSRMDKNKTGSLQTIVCLQTPGLSRMAEPDVTDIHDSLQGGYVTKQSMLLCLEEHLQTTFSLGTTTLTF